MNHILLVVIAIAAFAMAPVKAGLSQAARDLMNKRNAIISDIKTRKNLECRKYPKNIVDEVLREEKKILEFYEFIKDPKTPKKGYKVPQANLSTAALPLYKVVSELNREQVNKVCQAPVPLFTANSTIMKQPRRTDEHASSLHIRSINN